MKLSKEELERLKEQNSCIQTSIDSKDEIIHRLEGKNWTDQLHLQENDLITLNSIMKEITDCVTQSGYKIKYPEKMALHKNSYNEQDLRKAKIQEQAKLIRDFQGQIKQLTSANYDLKSKLLTYDKQKCKYEAIEAMKKNYDDDLKARFMKESLLQSHIDDLSKQLIILKFLLSD